MESKSQYFCSMLCPLLSSAIIQPAQWLIVNANYEHSLSQYLGFKYKSEFISLCLKANLAYEKDRSYFFNWNKTLSNYKRYSFQQMIVEYSALVKLSETIQLKHYNRLKLCYIRVGNFAIYGTKFSVAEQFSMSKPVEIISVRRIKNEFYTLTRPILKEVLFRLKQIANNEVLSSEEDKLGKSDGNDNESVDLKEKNNLEKNSSNKYSNSSPIKKPNSRTNYDEKDHFNKEVIPKT